ETDVVRYPSLILASRTTRPHFSISAATKARNSSGVFSRASTLSCLRRCPISGCRSTAFKPALSLLTMSAGVPAGTNTPFHSRASDAGRRPAVGGHGGRPRRPPGAGGGEPLGLPRLNMPDGGGGMGEVNFPLPADEIVEHGAAAAVGDVIELDAGAMLEHF